MKLVEKDPNKRLRASEALNHPWFTKLSNDENNYNNMSNNKMNSKAQSINFDYTVGIHSDDNESILSKSFVNDDNVMNVSKDIKPFRSPKIISCPSKDSIRLTSVDTHLKIALKKDFLMNLQKKCSIEISPEELKIIKQLESIQEFENLNKIEKVKGFLNNNNNKITQLHSQQYLKIDINVEEVNEIDTKAIPEEYIRDEDNVQTEEFNAAIELDKNRKYYFLYVCDHTICSIKPKISFQNFEKKK